MTSLFQPIINLLSGALSGIHAVTGDWGIAIVLLTLCVKALLYRFNLNAARQSIRSAAMQPKLQELRSTAAGDQQHLLQETMKLSQAYGIKPMASFIGILVQMPVLASMYSLFHTHGAAMASQLLPWLSHLALTDPWHLIPILSSALAFVSGLIPLTAAGLTPPSPALTQAALQAGSWRVRAGMSAAMAALPLFITWMAPAALGLYWITGTLFSLLEKAFYRTAIGRRLLLQGLPHDLVAVTPA